MSADFKSEIDIGSMLVRNNLISANQLRDAYRQQKLRGGYLSQHLIELGYIRDNDMTTCLTCQYGFCYIPLRSYDIEPSALQMVPAQFACHYCIIPIELSDRLLSVAMSDPLNRGVIEVLRQLTHCEILIFVSTRQEIKESIEKYYGVPFRNFDLDRYQHDIFLRDDLAAPSVMSGYYNGANRRRYKRVRLDLPGEYYYYPNIVRTKIINVSMSGILFETRSPLPKGTQLAVNLHLNGNKSVTGVVEVIRSTADTVVDSLYRMNAPSYHETGAFINFLSEDNQDALAKFLKNKISA